MIPGVFITVDVECSMGGAWGDPSLRPVPPRLAIMGDSAGRRLGLPLIVDILARNALAATFFVEAFNAEQGYPAGSGRICKYLMDRGQDVQLHIHPNHKHYARHLAGQPYVFTDNIADLPRPQRKALLAEGCERLARWTGRPPTAFRAGNMAASEELLEQLPEVGIKIDSSYTFPLAGRQCRLATDNPFNGSRWYGSVLEVALSGFYQPHLPGLHRAKLLDVVGISFTECRDAITAICRAGADAVVILHSFSLFKVRNVQYAAPRPDRIVTRRFRRLCEWLAEQRDEIPTYTFCELARAIAENRYSARAVGPLKLASVARPLIRKAVQAVNNSYWI